MRFLIQFVQLVVGLLFIFSGLVKADDPLGLSYKMQEFFNVWGWYSLNSISLTLSVIMISFEIIAGVALLLGWKFRLFSWLLLLLTIFFTFLTGYAALSGKIKECGCFGDCIKLSASASFYKDLALLALILFLLAFRNRVQPIFRQLTNLIILLFAAVASFSIQWYVLHHLPVVDCLPYKAGNNILEKMKVPAGAIPDSTIITFVYSKNGREVEFTADKFPADFDDSYKFVKRYDKLIRKGNAEAAIKDFSLITFSGNDTTVAVLSNSEYQLFLFLKDGYSDHNWPEYLVPIMQYTRQKKFPAYLITNIQPESLYVNSPEVLHELIPLRCDVTAIKTAARTNPTLYLIKNGTIVNKWGADDFEEALREVGK